MSQCTTPVNARGRWKVRWCAAECNLPVKRGGCVSWGSRVKSGVLLTYGAFLSATSSNLANTDLCWTKYRWCQVATCALQPRAPASPINGDIRSLLALRVARQRSNCEQKAGQVMWQGRDRRAKVPAQHSPCELGLGWRARPPPASREKLGALALVVRLEPGGVGSRLVREHS